MSRHRWNLTPLSEGIHYSSESSLPNKRTGPNKRTWWNFDKNQILRRTGWNFDQNTRVQGKNWLFYSN